MNNLRPILNTPKLSNNLQVWAPETISLEVRRPVRKAGQCRGEEFVELYVHSSNTFSWRGAQLKAQGQLYL